MGFDISCKLLRQFVWNVRSYFQHKKKKRKKLQNVMCWNFYPACKARKHSPEQAFCVSIYNFECGALLISLDTLKYLYIYILYTLKYLYILFSLVLRFHYNIDLEAVWKKKHIPFWRNIHSCSFLLQRECLWLTHFIITVITLSIGTDRPLQTV